MFLMKILYFDLNFHSRFYQAANMQKVIMVSGIGLASKSRQDINWMMTTFYDAIWHHLAMLNQWQVQIVLMHVIISL